MSKKEKRAGGKREATNAPLSADDDPYICISSTRIFKFRHEELCLVVSRPWRLKHHMEPHEIFEAGLSATCCYPVTLNEVCCTRCCGSAGKVVRICVASHSPSLDLDTQIEKYCFSVQSICSSSRDHIRSPVVIVIRSLGSTPLKTPPLHLRSRCPRKSPSSSPPSDPVTDTPNGSEDSSPKFSTNKVTAMVPPLLTNSIIQPYQSPTLYTPGPALLVIVRLLQVNIPPSLVSTAIATARFTAQNTIGTGMLAFQYKLVTPSVDGRSGVWLLTARYASSIDSAKGRKFFADIISNGVKNPFNSNLLSSNSVQSLALMTSW
ncbi:hypothetical protein Pelo_8503 [Pelomyxa schiedti]|nr:hypothetical protein Pelo_8503 [Pelomyxa schiedti]